MVAVEFRPPAMPSGAGSNDTGPPMPPSGLHESVSPQAVFTPTGPGWEPEHPAGAGTNVHVAGSE